MKNNSVLVIVAHSDDEVLGCGGTIAKHVSNGDTVNLLVLADGVSSRGTLSGKESRDASLKSSCNLLGIKSYKCLDFPDNRLDTVALLDIVVPVEKIIADFKPNIIYTHAFDDLNIDHSITHKAVMTACRPQKNSCPVKTIYSFYVPSSSEWCSPSMARSFTPNRFVNIEQFYSQKIDALKCYDDEMRNAPHPRSYSGVEAVAKFYGNIVGVEYAEVFIIEREIN